MMNTHRLLPLLSLLGLATSCIAAPVPPNQVALPSEPATPVEAKWKTVFFKRGFIGPLPVDGAGGVGGTIRVPFPVGMDGTAIRLSLGSFREGETVLDKLTVARGKEGAPSGTIEGDPVPITFDGKPGLTLAALSNNQNSDATTAAIKRGQWYLQQSYSSPRISSAYNVDGYYFEPGDQHTKSALAKSTRGGLWPGNVFRVDVLTTDTRPVVLCYGDSITHGYGATPNTGRSYPEVLSKLTNLPTLNLGVNSDVISQSGGAPGIIKSCRGVEKVILLLGINDIYRKSIKTPKQYQDLASGLIAALKQDGKQVFIGTITPTKGVPLWEKTPDREELRLAINEWIRNQKRADGVIDFDKALEDPQNPGKLREEYQSDWIHPSDAGYQKMAETAAAVLQAAGLKTP